MLHNLYYTLKPIIPRRLQIALRKKYASWLLSRNFENWPIDEQAAVKPKDWKGWPGGKKFALVLTHDVERAEGQNKCRELIRIEESRGFRASYNFVAEDYPVDRDLHKALLEKGFEIGLHGVNHGGSIFHSEKLFRREAPRINRYMKEWNCSGFRAPRMYHDLNMTHGLNLKYDSSTFDTDIFEPQPDGMRTIFPFFVPNGTNGKGYVELPYTLPQDFTTFVLLGHKNISLWKQKLRWIADSGGMALLITHPDYMAFNGDRPRFDEYPAEYYREFLDYIATVYRGQYWHALPREVARFWKDNYSEPARKKRRVCMLSYSFYDNDNRVMRYAEALAKRGDHVDVLSLRKNGEDKTENLRGVNVLKIQKRSPNEKSKLSFLYKLGLFLARSAYVLTKEHLKNPYDLIHVHSVPDFEIFATLIPKINGAKTILDIHDIVPEFYASKFNKPQDSLLIKLLLMVEKASTFFADHVIISNHIWQKKLLDRSVDEKKCSVILNYPDPSLFFSRPRTQNGKFTMLYPGTLGWHQGLDIAVKAFAKIKDEAPEAEFYIYGRGPEKDNLTRLVNELKLEDRVFIRNSVTIDRIADLMANADLGIVPKRNDPFGGEAFSTKIFEFMLLGVPLVVSRTKIDNFYFDDSLVKFFLPEDVDDLAQSMLQLIRDARYRDRLVQNSLLFIESYSWEGRKSEYLDLVDGLLGETRELEEAAVENISS